MFWVNITFTYRHWLINVEYQFLLLKVQFMSQYVVSQHAYTLTHWSKNITYKSSRVKGSAKPYIYRSCRLDTKSSNHLPSSWEIWMKLLSIFTFRMWTDNKNSSVLFTLHAGSFQKQNLHHSNNYRQHKKHFFKTNLLTLYSMMPQNKEYWNPLCLITLYLLVTDI